MTFPTEPGSIAKEIEDYVKDIPEARLVLNIQSHVTHGYVGNKASTFALQMLDWEVDVLNTVNLSNHTGYGSFEGRAATKEELLEIYKGLKRIDVKYDALITGYAGGAETLEAVGEICVDIKKRQENGKKVTWMLDPVMGDEGVLYVDEDVIPVYRKLLESQLVDIITPNQYELELIVDHKINCLNSLIEAMDLCHERYNVEHIVLSSLYADSFDDLEGGPDTFYCCISSRSRREHMVLYRIDKMYGYFTGVGDMFTALLLDRITKTDDITLATNEVLSVMRRVLRVTSKLSNGSGSINNSNMKDCELRVVECKHLYASRCTDYKPILLNK